MRLKHCLQNFKAKFNLIICLPPVEGNVSNPLQLSHPFMCSYGGCFVESCFIPLGGRTVKSVFILIVMCRWYLATCKTA